MSDLDINSANNLRVLAVNATRLEEVPLRLSMEWMTGTDNKGMEFQLTTGAGLGGAAVTLKVTIGDSVIYEELDMKAIVSSWVGEIVEEAKR